jgi:porphobilinogen synthase
MISGKFPHTRLRRIRMKSFARDLCKENSLNASDLILPLFIQDTSNQVEEIYSMPGVFRHTLDSLVKTCKTAHDLGIRAVALFPSIKSNLRTEDASAAWDPNGLVPVAVKAIKAMVPEIGIITDVALDPYTSHGQDGLLDGRGEIDNDRTIDALIEQALMHAKAGADIVAPSDMMDGRIGAIRNAFESQNITETLILAYSAKYASSFYGPFRDAVGSKALLGKSTKHTYQMDCANSREAVREISLDIDEGADFVMVKPGLPYLDIVKSAYDKFSIPIFAYNVSGEYSMVKAASVNGWIDEKAVVLELLLSFKRAGASAILSYHALDAAKWLSK